MHMDQPSKGPDRYVVSPPWARTHTGTGLGPRWSPEEERNTAEPTCGLCHVLSHLSLCHGACSSPHLSSVHPPQFCALVPPKQTLHPVCPSPNPMWGPSCRGGMLSRGCFFCLAGGTPSSAGSRWWEKPWRENHPKPQTHEGKATRIDKGKLICSNRT